MTPNEYLQFALRTEVTPLFVNGADGKPDRQLSRLMHAMLGMDTEQAELDQMITGHLVFSEPFDTVNVLEEAGDQLWYIALAVDALQWNMDVVMNDGDFAGALTAFDETPKYTVATIVVSKAARSRSGINVAQGDFADIYKKHFIYGKSVDKEAVRKALQSQLIFLNCLLVSCGYSLVDAMKRNIEKLNKRYPGKFTQEKALNRDLEAERAVLEAKD